MLMKRSPSRRGRAQGALAAAILSLATLEAAAAETVPSGASDSPATAFRDDSSSDKGLPPSPGPTDPDGP